MTEVMVDSPKSTTWWKSTWPLHLHQASRLLAALVVVVAVYVVIGEALTNWLAPNAIVDFDVETAEALVDGRTTSSNGLAEWGAFLANTPIKIGLSLLLAGLALWRWRRWYEAMLIGVTLIFEATAYVIASHIVKRPRPDVERLLDSPVATSFPSGHVAAATVYAVLAIIVFQRTRSLLARSVAVIAVVLLPPIVAWARMYQGMHYLSDVVAGSTLGIVSIVVCHRILRDHQPDTQESSTGHRRRRAHASSSGNRPVVHQNATADEIRGRLEPPN